MILKPKLIFVIALVSIFILEISVSESFADEKTCVRWYNCDIGTSESSSESESSESESSESSSKTSSSSSRSSDSSSRTTEAYSDSSESSSNDSLVTPKIQTSTSVPYWVKDVAGFWCEDGIDTGSFVDGIEFLVQNKIIQVNATKVTESSDDVPSWIKSNACWWSQGIITDDDFVNGIEFLIKKDIIRVGLD